MCKTHRKSIEYKDKIIDFIVSNIVHFLCRKSPRELQNSGSKYIFTARLVEQFGIYFLRKQTIIFWLLS
jgi:hypothetical protein